MIADEKIIHIVHLMLDGLENAGMVEYADKDKATREAKKVCLKFVSHMNAARDVAKNLISPIFVKISTGLCGILVEKDL